MTVHLDTSFLVHAFSSTERRMAVDRATEQGHILLISSLVQYEWLRGPRSVEQLALADALFPSESIAVFGPDEARVAAQLYRHVRRARARAADLAIAASAIEHGAALWTLNTGDFDDIPGLTLYRP
jgi:predicted nucleic acid-binding protein